MLFGKVIHKQHMELPGRGDLAGPSKVKAGFPSGTVNVDKAFYNEFGTSGSGTIFYSRGVVGFGGPIPERPFMRNSARNNRNKYKKGMKAAAPKILRGETSLKTVLSKLGIMMQNDIQQEITSLRSPPNAPLTVLIKGSSNPLIDSDEMRASVTWKIDD